MTLHIVNLMGYRITQKTSQWACLFMETGSTGPWLESHTKYKGGRELSILPSLLSDYGCDVTKCFKLQLP